MVSTTRLSADIPTELHKWLRVQAALQNSSLKDFLVKLLLSAQAKANQNSEEDAA